MIEIVPLGQLSLPFMSSFYCQLDKSVSPLNSVKKTFYVRDIVDQLITYSCGL